jgi:hypothetical protein
MFLLSLFQSAHAGAAAAGNEEGIAVEAIDGALAEDTAVPVDHNQLQPAARPKIAHGA